RLAHRIGDVPPLPARMKRGHDGETCERYSHRYPPSAFLAVEVAGADKGQAEAIDDDGVADNGGPERTFIALQRKNKASNQQERRRKQPEPGRSEFAVREGDSGPDDTDRQRI